MRDWASVAGRGRLLLSGSIAHASLKTAVHIQGVALVQFVDSVDLQGGTSVW